MSEAENVVEVGVRSFSDLFEETSFPIAVDTYQRGFIWTDEKIRQLISDLADYQDASSPKVPYYMGTVLVHRHAEKEKRFIIDGQQRLTALSVLHHQITGKLPSNCSLSYSPKSAKRVRKASKLFRDHPKCCDFNFNIFSKIVFTIIYVDQVDLAFTFFDTQNNRGLPLHATDLLKAYHLRAIDGHSLENKEALQTFCAQRWEGIQQSTPILSHDREFASALFTKFLWRARYWTGLRVAYGGHNALMREFQAQAWKVEGDDHATIPLYRSRKNRLGTALTLHSDGDAEIHTRSISLSAKARDLPFSIRQPIHEGVCFFLYSDKYASLLRWLVLDSAGAIDVRRFRDVYKKLLMANSLYLREIFLLSALIYADQFGDEKLFEFSLWLEHALGAIRLDKHQVRYETAQNFFKNSELNLLDIIANSFRPEQVVGHLQTYHTHRKVYEEEEIICGKGVQGRYKQAVLNYYGKPANSTLALKHTWIPAILQEIDTR